MLTKNSFLEEINKQYVVTARAKGLTERRVLYGHVFRNAMLLIVAGFPAAFIGILFTGALLIEIIFSLDGLGLLGFEAAISRDYPVMFGTLYIFTLIGLVMQLVGDLTYTLVDPRIDFEARGEAPMSAAPTRPAGAGSFAARPPPARDFRANRRGFWSLWIFLALFVVTLFAEFIANDRPLLIRYDGASISRCCADYPRGHVRRRFPADRGRLHRPRGRRSDRGEGLDALAADPLQLRHGHQGPARARARAAVRRNLLGTDDQARDVLARVIYGFRISVLFGLALTVITSIDRHRRRRRAGLFRRLGRPPVPALPRDLVEHAAALPADHPGQHRQPSFWIAARHHAAVQLDGLVGVVRAEFLRGRNFDYVRAAQGARHAGRAHHVAAHPAQRHGRDPDLPALHPGRLGDHPDLARLPGLRPAARLAVARRAALQGKNNLQAPWLGFTAFVVLGGMLTLLIFIGEAVRDAFDPRKVPTEARCRIR